MTKGDKEKWGSKNVSGSIFEKPSIKLDENQSWSKQISSVSNKRGNDHAFKKTLG